jgi:hypothetical protein
MSLPLTRRIARAALLVAAGAAPVVGAAGSASAVDLPTAAPSLSGLTALDAGAVESVAPAAESTVAPVVGQAQGAVGDAVGSTADLPAVPLPGAELPLG